MCSQRYFQPDEIFQMQDWRWIQIAYEHIWYHDMSLTLTSLEYLLFQSQEGRMGEQASSWTRQESKGPTAPSRRIFRRETNPLDRSLTTAQTYERKKHHGLAYGCITGASLFSSLPFGHFRSGSHHVDISLLVCANSCKRHEEIDIKRPCSVSLTASVVQCPSKSSWRLRPWRRISDHHGCNTSMRGYVHMIPHKTTISNQITLH